MPLRVHHHRDAPPSLASASLTALHRSRKQSLNFASLQVAPAKTPQVVGRLLDLDADEDFLKALLDSVRMLCPVDPLVEEVEKRNRLRLLAPWLEQRLRDGATDPGTHNALGKIYVTINKDPQNWLKTNPYYDSKVSNDEDAHDCWCFTLMLVVRSAPPGVSAILGVVERAAMRLSLVWLGG